MQVEANELLALQTSLRARGELDKAQLKALDADWVVDQYWPDAPLLISFAYINREHRPDFYLFSRSKKLEKLSGQRINRIMLRDCNNSWYLRGVPGLGDSVDEMLLSLQKLIAAIAPSCIWCIGESMGGYAAMMMGFLLGADRILSFGGLSSFEPGFNHQCGDMRWLPTMQSVSAAPHLLDLPQLAQRCRFQGQLHLVVGTSAGSDAPLAVNLDVMHAQRFAAVPGVVYHYYPAAEHTVTHWLVYRKAFDAILLHCLFDHPLPTPAPLPNPVAKPAPAVWPLQFEKLDQAALDLATRRGEVVLVDRIEAGAPLLICLNDHLPGQAAEHTFFTLRNKLEQALGQSLNLILLRDPHAQWYLRGLPGLGENIEQVAQRLLPLLDKMQAQKIVCVGSGMGAYGALLLAPLLGAHKAVAFSPLSILSAKLAHQWHDQRYLSDLARLEQTPQPLACDLLPLLAAYQGEVIVAFDCIGPGSGNDVASHDLVHAQRLACLPQVKLFPWPANQPLLPWMMQNGSALDLLQHMALN